MNNILTSDRARAVLDKIGWPEWTENGERRQLRGDRDSWLVLYWSEPEQWWSCCGCPPSYHFITSEVEHHLRAWLAKAWVETYEARFCVHREDGLWLGADGRWRRLFVDAAMFATDHEALLAAAEGAEETDQ